MLNSPILNNLVLSTIKSALAPYGGLASTISPNPIFGAGMSPNPMTPQPNSPATGANTPAQGTSDTSQQGAMGSNPGINIPTASKAQRGYNNTPTKQTSGQPNSPGRPPIGTRKSGSVVNYKTLPAQLGQAAGSPSCCMSSKPIKPKKKIDSKAIKSSMFSPKIVPISVPRNRNKLAQLRPQNNNIRNITNEIIPHVADHLGYSQLGLENRMLGMTGVPLTGATTGVGTALGAILGTGAGAIRGNTPEGLGRGFVRGGLTGAGTGVGTTLGAILGNIIDHKVLGNESTKGVSIGAGLGGVIGGLGSYYGSGKLLGKPSTNNKDKKRVKEATPARPLYTPDPLPGPPREPPREPSPTDFDPNFGHDDRIAQPGGREGIDIDVANRPLNPDQTRRLLAHFAESNSEDQSLAGALSNNNPSDHALSNIVLGLGGIPLTGALAGAGLSLGGLSGSIAGKLRGNTMEGLGRGLIRGTSTGAGAGAGMTLGSILGNIISKKVTGEDFSPSAAGIGGGIGAGLGGLAGWYGSGKLLGKPMGDNKKNKENL